VISGVCVRNGDNLGVRNGLSTRDHQIHAGRDKRPRFPVENDRPEGTSESAAAAFFCKPDRQARRILVPQQLLGRQ
jgi:hypothetical protein